MNKSDFEALLTANGVEFEDRELDAVFALCATGGVDAAFADRDLWPEFLRMATGGGSCVNCACAMCRVCNDPEFADGSDDELARSLVCGKCGGYM